MASCIASKVVAWHAAPTQGRTTGNAIYLCSSSKIIESGFSEMHVGPCSADQYLVAALQSLVPIGIHYPFLSPVFLQGH